MDSTTPDPQPQPQQQPQSMQPQPRPQQQQQHQPHQPKPQPQQQQQQQQQQQPPPQPHPHQHQSHPHQQHQSLPAGAYRPVQAHPTSGYSYYSHQSQMHPFAQPQPYQPYPFYTPAWTTPQAANFNSGMVPPPQPTNVPQLHTKQAPQIMNPAVINTDQSHPQTLQTVTTTNQPVAPVPQIREKKLAVLKDPVTNVVLPLGTPTTTTTTTTNTTTTTTTSTTADKTSSSASSSTTTAPSIAVTASSTVAAPATATTASTLSATTKKDENKRGGVDSKRQEESSPVKNVQTKQNPAQALLQKASEDGLEIKTPLTKNNGQKKAETKTDVTNIDTTTRDKKVSSSVASSSPIVEASIPQEKATEKINGKDADSVESCKVTVKLQLDSDAESAKKVSEVSDAKPLATPNNGQDSKVSEDTEIAQDTSESSPQVEARVPVQDGDHQEEKVNGNNADVDDSNKKEQESDSKVELNYEPGQYNPISNRTGKKVYSKEFMLEVCEKICKLDLSHKESDDKIGMESNRLQDALSEKVDFFKPTFHGSSQGYTPINRQNEPARRQSQHIYAGRSSAGQDRQRKVITSVSLTQEVELKTTSNPWRPTKEIKEDAPADEADTETLKKKFRSILNKLTPNNFENLAHAVTDLNIDTESKLGEVIDIVFAKALAEPGYCVLYGQMCSHLKKITAGQANFGNTLLKRCQHQFQSDIYSGLNLKERREKIENEEDAEVKKQLNEELYEDMYRCRMKGLGLIKFIGELYKIEMLNDQIMLDCVQRLLSDTSEESLECLCDLLTTIGEKLDKSSQKNAEKQKKAPPKSVPKANVNYSAVVAGPTSSQQQAQRVLEQQGNLTTLDQVFDQLHKIRKNKDLPLSVRMRFKLLDTCELREKDSWHSKKTKDNNPKKIEEIREAHKEKLEQERRQQSAMGPRRSQEGRRGLGHSGGSSSQISSMANESSGNRSQSNMHTSSSSHLLRDHSTGDNMKSNHNEIESQKEHQKKIETFLKNSSSRSSSSAEPLRPKLLRPTVSLRPNSAAPAPSATPSSATPPTTTTSTTTPAAGPAPGAATGKNEDNQ